MIQEGDIITIQGFRLEDPAQAADVLGIVTEKREGVLVVDIGGGHRVKIVEGRWAQVPGPEEFWLTWGP